MNVTKLSRQEIIAALADRLDKVKPGSHEEAKLSAEIAAYLLETGRAGELNSLLRDIMLWRASHGVVEVTAVSAFPLSAGVRTDIEAEVKRIYPEAKQVIISERSDPEVVAGVRLEFADKRYDLTARHKLNRLKQLTAAR